MHERKIGHWDFHSGNILINKKGEIKIIDFEKSGDFYKTRKDIGCESCLPPEVARRYAEDHPSIYCRPAIDYWTLGVILYRLKKDNSSLPWSPTRRQSWIDSTDAYFTAHSQEQFESDLKLDLQDPFDCAIQGLLQIDPNKRIPLEKVESLLDQIQEE